MPGRPDTFAFLLCFRVRAVYEVYAAILFTDIESSGGCGEIRKIRGATGRKV